MSQGRGTENSAIDGGPSKSVSEIVEVDEEEAVYSGSNGGPRKSVCEIVVDDEVVRFSGSDEGLSKSLCEIVEEEEGGYYASNEGKNKGEREMVVEDEGIGYSVPSERRSKSICEIVEVDEEEKELFEIKQLSSIKEENDSSIFSIDLYSGEDDIVYVVILNEESSSTSSSSPSKDAVIWTLGHAVNPSTVVYLIHVFPEIRYMPTPIGKLPISQANPKQKETYLTQERSKRREFLQKFLDLCSASKVAVETVLIESDLEAKAVLDLIPILNIRKLVLGATKSSLRKMGKKGSGTVNQILQNAPTFCEVKIICEGKEVLQDQFSSAESSPSSPPSNVSTPKASNVTTPAPAPTQVHEQINESFRCSCFKPKVAS